MKELSSDLAQLIFKKAFKTYKDISYASLKLRYWKTLFLGGGGSQVSTPVSEKLGTFSDCVPVIFFTDWGLLPLALKKMSSKRDIDGETIFKMSNY